MGSDVTIPLQYRSLSAGVLGASCARKKEAVSPTKPITKANLRIILALLLARMALLVECLESKVTAGTRTGQAAPGACFTLLIPHDRSAKRRLGRRCRHFHTRMKIDIEPKPNAEVCASRRLSRTLPASSVFGSDRICAVVAARTAAEAIGQ